jgi:hypothetical protein
MVNEGELPLAIREDQRIRDLEIQRTREPEIQRSREPENQRTREKDPDTADFNFTRNGQRRPVAGSRSLQ